MLKIGSAIKNSLIKKSINLVIQDFKNSLLVFKTSNLSSTIKNLEKFNIDFLIIDYKLINNTYYDLKKLQSIKQECKIILFINNEKYESIPLEQIKGVIHNNINSRQLENILNRLANHNNSFLKKNKWISEFNYNPEYNCKLTKRQKQILEQLINKKTSRKEIADSLNISRNTVDNHLNKIFQKLSVHNKIQAITEALKNDLVHFSSSKLTVNNRGEKAND